MKWFTLRQRNIRMTITVAIRLVLACCWLIFWGTPALSDVALDVLVAAYPEQLATHDDQNLVWKDGIRQPLSDGQTNKTFDDLLNHPSIIDQFKIRYRLGPQTTSPAINEDPGRIRNEDFFKKMYGDCRKGEVADQLRRVAWLPHRGGETILATRVNGVAEKLEQISAELEKTPTVNNEVCSAFGRRLLVSQDRRQWPHFNALLRRGDRSQRQIRRLLALEQEERRYVQSTPSNPISDCRYLRTIWIHLGWQVVSF
jgi:hypothetical protein